MKHTHFILAAMVVAGSLFTGCKHKKQDNISPATTNNPSSSLKEFFANNGAKKQVFKVNIDNSNATITGDKGTTVTIPQGAFRTAGGQAATGEISVQLVEIFDKADMVLSDRPTTSNGQLLVSGGEIYIGATADGEQLQLNDNTSIRITLPADTVQSGMTLFTGSVDSSQFNWTVMPNVVQSQSGGSVYDSTWAKDTVPYFYYNPSEYIFTVTTLGWINCDRFYNAPSTTTINIVCNGVVDPYNYNTRAYLIFKDINSISQLWSSGQGIYQSSLVPEGEKVTMMIFSLKEGKEYVAIKDVTVTSNLQITVDLQEASEQDIKSLISQRFN
jgi:hypothetical protein